MLTIRFYHTKTYDHEINRTHDIIPVISQSCRRAPLHQEKNILFILAHNEDTVHAIRLGY